MKHRTNCYGSINRAIFTLRIIWLMIVLSSVGLIFALWESEFLISGILVAFLIFLGWLVHLLGIMISEISSLASKPRRKC